MKSIKQCFADKEYPKTGDVLAYKPEETIRFYVMLVDLGSWYSIESESEQYFTGFIRLDTGTLWRAYEKDTDDMEEEDFPANLYLIGEGTEESITLGN